jgi:hypothetical protein
VPQKRHTKENRRLIAPQSPYLRHRVAHFATLNSLARNAPVSLGISKRMCNTFFVIPKTVCNDIGINAIPLSRNQIAGEVLDVAGMRMRLH